MAYSNIPVADTYQAVQQIANFASTVGWTIHQDRDRVQDTSWRIVTMSAGGAYLTLIGKGNDIYANCHRGFDPDADWDRQPDQYHYYDGDGSTSNDTQEQYTRCRLDGRVTPILSVHLFGNMAPTPYIYAAVELEPGFYRHLVLGHFELFGTQLGGTFFDISSNYGTQYASYHGRHRAPFLYNTHTNNKYNYGGFDSQDAEGNPDWISFGGSTGYSVGGCWGNEVYSFFVGSPIQFNSRTPLMTPLVWVSKNGYRPIGTPPNFRYVSLAYYEAGDEFTVGDDTWKVFPWARRQYGKYSTSYASPADEATHHYGIAYLKD